MVETISFNTFTAFSSREDFFSSAPSALLFSLEPSLASSLTTYRFIPFVIAMPV